MSGFVPSGFVKKVYNAHRADVSSRGFLQLVKPAMFVRLFDMHRYWGFDFGRILFIVPSAKTDSN